MCNEFKVDDPKIEKRRDSRSGTGSFENEARAKETIDDYEIKGIYADKDVRNPTGSKEIDEGFLRHQQQYGTKKRKKS